MKKNSKPELGESKKRENLEESISKRHDDQMGQMGKMEKMMHGKNVGKNFKSYKSSKGGA